MLNNPILKFTKVHTKANKNFNLQCKIKCKYITSVLIIFLEFGFNNTILKFTKVHTKANKNFSMQCKFYQELLKEKSNPRLKGNRKGIIVKGKEFYILILNTFPTR